MKPLYDVPDRAKKTISNADFSLGRILLKVVLRVPTENLKFLLDVALIFYCSGFFGHFLSK